MHVGHLRTTIVGDAIARILDFELASQFTAFYEQCPVLRRPTSRSGPPGWHAH